MKSRKLVLALGFVCMFLVSTNRLGYCQDNFSYLGAAGCKACHMTKKSGAAFKIWQETKHANAFVTLASEKAKTIAKEKGIADPQKSGECLSCHVTGHGVKAAQLGKKYKVEDGVGCESCHGPGSAYKSLKTMKGITAGDIKAASVGLIKPDESVCKKCHNAKSPSFKPFDFKARSAQIAHPIPG